MEPILKSILENKTENYLLPFFWQHDGHDAEIPARVQKIYESGQGKIRLRGKVETEQVKGGKERLVITEIPYTMMGANIGKFLNDIASLVETKKTTDIVDISNQSSKAGIRIVLELKKEQTLRDLKTFCIKRHVWRIHLVSICLRLQTEDRKR